MLLRFKNLVKVVLATVGLLLVMGFVARAVAADDDQPLPEEIQMESTGQPPIPPPAGGKDDMNLDAAPATAQAPEASGSGGAPATVQNAEIISFIDSLNFGKDQFSSASPFRREGQLSSRVVK